MLPTLNMQNPTDRASLDQRLGRLRLNPVDLALARGSLAEKERSVRDTIADVAARGDEAIVEISRKFDDEQFDSTQICVQETEMAEAAARISPPLASAIKRAIAQLTEYQRHIMPVDPPDLVRPGVRLGMRFTSIDSAGCYFPGGKASYPSSLIHLAVPAIVAGVSRVIVCTPPSRYGRSDVVLAACHFLGLKHVYRAGGAAAIAAMAFGTASIPAVEKIVGPGNDYVQLAKRAVSGGVGIDGYLGPSEVLVIADETARPAFIAADLIAQAEHDPGSCFLLTTSPELVRLVYGELNKQLAMRGRRDAIERSLKHDSVVVLSDSLEELLTIANQLAAEHVNLQCRDNDAVLNQLRHAGAVFVGPWSPVAAGDYVAGPSHCLPTNTTARFSSGVSVYEFLKRSSVVRYDRHGVLGDAESVIALATEEHLDGHAASVEVRRAAE
ncbi:MAG TPA: histidinol dehydrogenase [Tepidisphaeraceae bacterium]|nr:histidinol dehydrogenase [Tepidisphaeraceae bacterium]